MKKWLLLVLISAILLSSCSTSLPFDFGSLTNFFGGSGQQVGGRGVTLKFLQPSSNQINIPEGIPFTIKLEVNNYVINDFGIHGELCIRDTVTENFGGIPDNVCNRLDLDSAKKDPNGAIINPKPQTFSFGPYTYKGGVTEFASSSQTQIVADVKYEVDSKSHSTMCIQRSNTQSYCSQEQNLNIDQSDLPLKVSNIKATTLSIDETTSNVLLEITFSKTVDGQLVSSGQVLTQALPGSALVPIDISINGLPATCNGLVEGNMLEITQDQNQKIIKCSTRVILNQDYIQEAPIEIKIDYGFIQSISGPIIQFSKEEALR